MSAEAGDGDHSNIGDVDQTEAEVLEGICRAVNMMEDNTVPGAIYVKTEHVDDGTEVIGEEVVMEELAEIPEGQDEMQEDNTVILPDSFMENKICYKVVQNDEEEEDEDTNQDLISGFDPSQQKVDKDDPRSRLHYIKYMKKEGKAMKMWECGICGKEFRHQYTLMRHLPTHTDERNYKCEDCGKAFRQMSTLSQHRAIHSDARPYVCECCKKTFNRVSTLISHRKTHSDLKPHKCPVCFKGFHQKGNLRNHVFTHTNERPYKCEICNKGFNQMSNLVCHKAHVHGDKSRHVCRICGNEFLRRYALRLHEEYKHGIQYQNSRIQSIKEASASLGQATKNDETSNPKKSLRIIHLPSGDRTLLDTETRNKILNTASRRNSKNTLKFIKSEEDEDSTTSSNSLSREGKVSPAGVIIDPIETKAMKNAKEAGQTPFALLKPAKGIPVLVKVKPAPNGKQMLVPATVQDLKSAGKITVSPNYDSSNNGNPIKAVQIKVPVVATVIQQVGENGQLTISVESPGPEQTQADVTSEPFIAETKEEEEIARDDTVISQEEEEVQFVEEDSTLVSMDEVAEPEIQYIQDDGTLVSAAQTVIMHEDGTIVSGDEVETIDQQQVEEYTVLEDMEGASTPGLLELASAGEIQLVRPSEGGTYEVLSQEEAAQLIQNHGQAIEIMGDNSDLQLQEMLEEGVDGEVLVNQNNLSALVSAMRSAGYEVLGDDGEEILEESVENIASQIAADEAEVSMTLSDSMNVVNFKADESVIL